MKFKLPHRLYKFFHFVYIADFPNPGSFIKIYQWKLSFKQVKIPIQLNQLINKIQLISADTIPFWERLSTGCDNINSITNGGIPFNGITEIYGESGVGKTQFCLQLALMAQMPKHLNGKEQCVVYICTEDVFPSKRFNQLTKEFQTEYNLNHIDFEDNLFLQHVNDFNQLKTCFQVHLPVLLKVKRIGLIVIDSIAGLFRSESIKNLSVRSRQFSEIAKQLNILNDRGICVICVNQVSINMTN